MNHWERKSNWICSKYDEAKPMGWHRKVQYLGQRGIQNILKLKWGVCVCVCVCVCVRLFLLETEDTNQRIKIKSRTTPQTVDCPRFPSIREMVQTNANACGVDTRVKKTKSNVAGQVHG